MRVVIRAMSGGSVPSARTAHASHCQFLHAEGGWDDAGWSVGLRSHAACACMRCSLLASPEALFHIHAIPALLSQLPQNPAHTHTVLMLPSPSQATPPQVHTGSRWSQPVRLREALTSGQLRTASRSLSRYWTARGWVGG